MPALNTLELDSDAGFNEASAQRKAEERKSGKPA